MTLEKIFKTPQGYFDGYPIRILKMNIMAVEYAVCNL